MICHNISLYSMYSLYVHIHITVFRSTPKELWKGDNFICGPRLVPSTGASPVGFSKDWIRRPLHQRKVVVLFQRSPSFFSGPCLVTLLVIVVAFATLEYGLQAVWEVHHCARQDGCVHFKPPGSINALFTVVNWWEFAILSHIIGPYFCRG